MRRVLPSSESCLRSARPQGSPSLEQHRDSLAFRSSRPGEIVVPVTVNGTGPFPFLLDTGSSHTVSIAARSPGSSAPLPSQRRSCLSARRGCPGRRTGSTTSCSGRLTAKAVMASVVPDDALCREHRIRGLLGQDVLALSRYTLDFRDRLVIWGDPADPPGHVVSLGMTPSAGRYLVDVPQGEAMLRLVPDSGAESVVLFAGTRRLPLVIATRAGRARALNPDRTCERRRGQTGAASSWPAQMARSPGRAPQPARTLPHPRATGCSHCTCSTV